MSVQFQTMTFWLLITLFLVISPPDEPGVDWMPFADALAVGAMEGKPVMVYVHAPWCGPCHKLDKEVFADSTIQHYLESTFITTKLNFDTRDDRIEVGDKVLSSQDWVFQLGAETVPTMVFLDTDGRIITRLGTYLPAQEFQLVLQFVATQAYEVESFKAFRQRHG